MPQLFVHRRKFLVGGLGFFLGSLQLLIGTLKFLVGRQNLFICALEFLVGTFLLLNDRLEVFTQGTDFLLELGQLEVTLVRLGFNRWCWQAVDWLCVLEQNEKETDARRGNFEWNHLDPHESSVTFREADAVASNDSVFRFRLAGRASDFGK